MSEIDFTGIAMVLTAIGTLVTAVGIAIVGVIVARQKKASEEQGVIIKQVERQGNSVSLELKRTNMVYAMRLAAAERNAANLAIANEAKTVYEEAKKQFDADTGGLTKG